MKRRPSELALVAVSLVCVLILAACNCAPTLRYITISPTGPIVVPGAQVSFVATGYYSNGAVTPNISVSWSSSSTAVATINGTSGVATGVATGTTTITATALGITSGTTTLTVAPLTAITVTPATTTISVTGTGNTQQFDAMGTYTTSTGTGTMDVTAFATWAAVNTGVATFSTTTNGLATAVAPGTTQVTATLDGITGTATLNVTNGTSLVVTPATANLAVGNAVALTVMEQLPNNTTQPVTGTVTWSSATPAQANVVQYGTGGAAIVAGFASSGTGAVTITATEGTLTGTTAITVDQGTTKYAYVSNSGGSPNYNIGSYTVTASAAPYLATLGTTTTGGNIPFQTSIDPNGNYLFVTSTSASSTMVTPYTIAANGSLTAGTAVSVSSTADITYTLIDPYGRFLFVADQGNSSAANGGIYVYTINQMTGALTLVTGSPFTSNLNVPAGLAMDQSGTYLYASNYGNPTASPAAPGTTIAGFQVDPNAGTLTPLSTPTFTNSLSGPYYMAWDPTGTYLYVANNYVASGANPTVSSFTLGANGALTSLTTTTVTGATAPLNVAVTPNGSYLYALDGVGGLYGFTLSSGTPSSTLISGSPYATGSAPTGIAIDPTSSLLAVDNSAGGIYIFTIGTGGVLTAPSNSPISDNNTPYFVTFYNTF
jgi:trimeric autotransporter adhesin